MNDEGVVFQESDSDESCRKGLDRSWEVDMASLFGALARLPRTPYFSIFNRVKVFRIDQPHVSDFRSLQTLRFNHRPHSVRGHS